MNSIPSSVEQALLEAGFSATEVLILKHLLNSAVTLRELAARTGKSTGVLDQAMKKLLRKNIVVKELVNDSSKFAIQSMTTVLDWINQDAKQKRDLLSRRSQNFESFIRSLEQDKHKPLVEHYDGLEGLAQAYRKLLDCGNEFLQFVPVICAAEDHPLRDFYVELFRSRRGKKIFSRVIAHDTPLGRRYASRDPFEYRQTILVPEEQFPFTFEKIIVGDTVASFNHIEKRAFLLRSKELAATERSIFEGLWRGEREKAEIKKDVKGQQVISMISVAPPLSTRIFSSLREFFLSPRSLISIAILAAIALTCSFVLYKRVEKINLLRMRERALDIASTAALQIDPEDLKQLRTKEDWKKPQWEKIVRQLEGVRLKNPDILFVYLLRKSSNSPSQIEFIADSHSINPFANTDDDPENDVDANNDGIISEPDVLQWPGQPNPSPPSDIEKAFEKEYASENFHEDSFGIVMTGYGSIRDINGESIAVLAVDIEASKLKKWTNEATYPILTFVILFSIFACLRFFSFNRSLAEEILQLIKKKKLLLILTIIAELVYFIALGSKFYLAKKIQIEAGERLMSIATVGALQFSPNELDELHIARDMKKDSYQKIFKKLNTIRSSNNDIRYAYILRSVESPYLWEFVVDADSNYFLPSYSSKKIKEEVSGDLDENVAPGVYYFGQDNVFDRALKSPSYSTKPYHDQWGIFITGTAPIANSAYILALDFNITNVNQKLHFLELILQCCFVISFIGVLNILIKNKFK